MPNKKFPACPVAVITGASAGLGAVIASRLHREGYQIVLVGRNRESLILATQHWNCSTGPAPLPLACDVTDAAQVQHLVAEVAKQYGRLDVLVNVVGQSDRGLIADLQTDHLRQLLETNLMATLLCSQACLPMLEQSRGVIVNIGSLASKVGARYLGGYPAAKHALAGLTQQMRLEWKPRGVHVGLLNPGPIQRQDAGSRYEKQVRAGGELPAQATRPGGGTCVKGLPPEQVANAVLRMIRRRTADVLLPGYLRPLVAVGHLWPRLGDWLLLKFTSSGN